MTTVFSAKLLFAMYLAVTLWVSGSIAHQKYDFCSVCRALVLEADEMIKDVDPKKTIQTGSFRVDPKGNQKITDKQYARSNTHLEEVVESVCSKLRDYADRILEDGSRHLVRVQGYSDEYNDDLKLDYDKGKSLQYQCESYLEDFEEEIISYLQDEDVTDHEKYICVDKTGVCSSQQLETKLETFQRPRERHNVEVEGAEGEDGGEDENKEEEGEEETERQEEQESENGEDVDEPEDDVNEKDEL